MLHIIISDGSWEPVNFIRSAQTEFNIVFENWWMEDSLLYDALLDIDKSKIIRPRIIESPILGDITPKEVSGGFKLVAMMLKYETDWIYNLDNAGDNCAKWIQKVAGIKDNTALCVNCMEMSDEVPLNIHIVNNNSYPKTAKEFRHEWVRCCEDDWDTFYRNTHSEIEVQFNT